MRSPVLSVLPAPHSPRRGPSRARALLAALTILPWLAGLPAQAQVWPADWHDSLRQARIPAEAVSVWVAPADGGPPRVAHEADRLRRMASLMKLFTTGAALQQLGPAHTWRTEAGLGAPLSPDGRLIGPLHLRTGGDPGLVIERLQWLMTQWRQAGLTHIDGDIVVDRSAFVRPEHDPAAFDGQGLRPYNAGPDPLLLNQQATMVVLRPRAQGGWEGSIEPALAGVQLTLVLSAPPTACHGGRNNLTLQTAPIASAEPGALRPWEVRVQGALPPACGELTWPLLWQGDGPGDHAERLLRATWQQLGGTWRGRLREGNWPATVAVWRSVDSAPLGQVVRDINKFSNNVMARQLLLTLPQQPGTTLTGARAHLEAAVQRALPSGACGPGALVVDNGSGLSRVEGSTARCMGAWLTHLWRSPEMPDFVASLPITSVDGTTRRWTGAAGHAHVKTGSLDGVTGVAGYVLGQSGQRYVVVAVVDHPQAGQARGWLNAVLEWVRNDAAQSRPAQTAANQN